MNTNSNDYLETWRSIIASHAALTSSIQKALVAADLPPVSWYETLLAIKQSPTGRPRMSELAEYLTLSRGGITKLVDRLVEAGYIERISCTDDRRTLQAEITAAGKKILAEMQSVYEREVTDYFATMDIKEAQQIKVTLEKVTKRTCQPATAH